MGLTTSVYGMPSSSQVDEKVFAFVCNRSVTEAIKYSLLCDGERMLEKATKQLEVHCVDNRGSCTGFSKG
jgi:hypothetical protein